MKLWVSVALIALLAGCSKEQPGGEVSTGGGSAGGDAVVITVNDRKLTKKELDGKVEMLVKLSSVMNPKMTLADVKNLRKKLSEAYPKQFRREVAVDEYVKRRKVAVGTNAVEKAKKHLLGSFRGAKLTYAALRRKAGEHAGLLDDYIQTRARDIAASQYILDTHPLKLPPNYITNQLSRIKAYNERMALTNTLVYARATNVWQKLKGGADFKATARAFSEVPREAQEGGDWGTLGLNQLEPDEQLAEWAQKLTPGEISPPIEGDNGLMILKVNSRKGDDYSLSRIYFRLPMFTQEVTAEQLLTMKKQQHDRAVLDKTFKRLVKRTKVVRSDQDGDEKAKLRKNRGKAAKKTFKHGANKAGPAKEALKANSKVNSKVKEEKGTSKQ